MDNNLLKQLILRHRRVVIPDFGAFLKKETPEGEALVFSPFLRKDDGVVTNAIVREYGVETEDARAMVSEFVIYLRQSLASSGKYYIEGIGMLAADANGTVTLREGEQPEREPVIERESPVTAQQPIQPIQPVQPVAAQQPIPQPIQQQQPIPQPVAQPVQPMQQPAMMSRPQSIQMQGQVPQQPFMQQPLQQPRQMPLQPQQQQRQMPLQPQPQQRQMPLQQQPQPQAQQRQMPMQQQPQPQQRQMPMQQQRPTAVQQQGIAQQQQQRPMNGGMGRPGGMAGGGSQHPGGGNRPGAGQGQRRPGAAGHPVRRRQPKTKTDIWLVVAIIAALVVIAIMIYKFVVIDMQNDDIDMNFLNESMSAAPTETVDSGLDDTGSMIDE